MVYLQGVRDRLALEVHLETRAAQRARSCCAVRAVQRFLDNTQWYITTLNAKTACRAAIFGTSVQPCSRPHNDSVLHPVVNYLGEGGTPSFSF